MTPSTRIRLAVAVGGAAGTAGRMAIGTVLTVGAATLLVNVVGCVVLGVATGRLRSTEARALLGTGFAGALTTFSGFAVESLELFGESPLAGAAYLGTSLFVGVAAASLGLRLGHGPGAGDDR